MERAIEVYAIIHFTVVGLSHILQPRAWVAFFVLLRERGAPGVFAIAFLTLAFGSIVAAFHNVWSGIPLVLTLIGWAQVVKGLIYFCFPAVALRSLQMPTEKRANVFVVGGFAFLALAALLGYHLWSTA
jgi:hypothetical protein